MKRRKALSLSAGAAGIAGLNAASVFAANSKRFGDSIIPPEKESGKEKHVAIITAPMSAKKGEAFTVTVEVGKTVPHPNTVEHHIAMIQLYALSEDSMYAVNIGTFNLGPTVASPKITIPVILQQNATLYALGYCNLHGVWDYSVEVKVS